MKWTYYLIIICISLPLNSFNITVKQDPFGTRVYISPTRAGSDLVVYLDPTFAEHDREEIWQWVDVFPDFKIKITQSRSFAKLIVFFANCRCSLGWQNKNHPLKGHLKK